MFAAGAVVAALSFAPQAANANIIAKAEIIAIIFFISDILSLIGKLMLFSIVFERSCEVFAALVFIVIEVFVCIKN